MVKHTLKIWQIHDLQSDSKSFAAKFLKFVWSFVDFTFACEHVNTQARQLRKAFKHESTQPRTHAKDASTEALHARQQAKTQSKRALEHAKQEIKQALTLTSMERMHCIKKNSRPI